MTYTVNAILIIVPVSYFVDIDKLILKFIWRGKRLRISNTLLEDWHYLISRFTAMSDVIKTWGIGERIDSQ